MKHDLSPRKLRRFVRRMSDIDVSRAQYCYQIGSTFLAAAYLEDAVVTAMLVCDRVKVAGKLGEDLPAWDSLLKKQKHLQESTLGSLISILSKHGLEENDLKYLTWLKGRRDFFIHRFFRSGAWPGDLNEYGVEKFGRDLAALEIHFHRGSRRIMPMLGRAGLMELLVFPGEGTLAMNPDALECL